MSDGFGGRDARTPADWDRETFRADVEKQLLAFVEDRATVLEPLGEDAERLLGAARQAVTGGKRFRAAFCYWGYRACVAPDAAPVDTDALLRACASLELLHASALVHDDLMDASAVRRGHATTHRAFAALHEQREWRGDAEQYGMSAALLLGDLLLSWADELLRTCGLPGKRVRAAQSFFDLTRAEVVAGQFLDVSAQARSARDIETALLVLRYKSAKYSVERPLHIGAALAGADAEVTAQLTRFGLPLGEAFQLRDDLLGVFGDPTVTGKPAGDDLTEGKRTALVALALDGLPSPEAALLDHSLGRVLDADEVSHLRHLIDRSGARMQIEEVIVELTQRAVARLDEARIDDGARAVLRDLAKAATQRVD